MNNAHILIEIKNHRKSNYLKALRRLRAIGTVVDMSSVYETASIGNQADQTYYAGVILLETELDAAALKRALGIIETQLEHAPSAGPDMPCPVDLNVVLFNQSKIDDEYLHVPDPQIFKRPFLALALAEISPDYVHPGDGRTLREIACDFGENPLGVRIEEIATVDAMQIVDHTLHHGEWAHA